MCHINVHAYIMNYMEVTWLLYNNFVYYNMILIVKSKLQPHQKVKQKYINFIIHFLILTPI